MAKQKVISVNEDFMKDIISQGIPVGGEISEDRQNTRILAEEKSDDKVEVKPRDNKRRKEQELPYTEEYLKRIDFEDRQMITITRLTHSKLLQIINILGGKQATLGSYVENIIRKHFETYKDEINRLCQEQPLKPL